MARNFCAILLAFGYAVLFVALSFVLVADNFYSYRDFGEFSYFSFVPFGFFAVCALAYMRFLAPAAGPVLLGFLVFWAACFAHWGFPSGCWAQGGFPLSMRALSAAFLAGSPALFFACGASLLCARGASAGRGRCSRFRRLCSRIFARRKSRRFRSRRARASRWRLPQPRSRAPREGFFQAGVSGPPLRRRAVRPS